LSLLSGWLTRGYPVIYDSVNNRQVKEDVNSRGIPNTGPRISASITDLTPFQEHWLEFWVSVQAQDMFSWQLFCNHAVSFNFFPYFVITSVTLYQVGLS